MFTLLIVSISVVLASGHVAQRAPHRQHCAGHSGLLFWSRSLCLRDLRNEPRQHRQAAGYPECIQHCDCDQFWRHDADVCDVCGVLPEQWNVPSADCTAAERRSQIADAVLKETDTHEKSIVS